MQRLRLVVWLRSTLWLVPLVCVAAAVALSLGLLALDRGHPGLVPSSVTGSSDDVNTILSTIASSMVTLTTLVLTITTVAVQLSMGQFSPRIVRALLQDRKSQFAYGLFAATFTFALVALRGLNEPKGFIPSVTVLTAYALTLASIGTLFLYMHHAGQRLSAAGLIQFVGDQLTAEVESYPAARGFAEEPADAHGVVPAGRGGVADELDLPGLVSLAADAGCRLEIVPRLGDFVPGGAPLARVHWGDAAAPRDLTGEVRRRIVLAPSRSHSNDPSYGMRKLVDIAERSLSSGPFTDPTTAVQALDRLHDALRQLARRELPPTDHHDSRGALRVSTRELEWDGFVRLAFDEIRLAGVASPQVARRLRAAIVDLLSVAPPQRREPLQRQLTLLDAGVRRAFDDDVDKVAMAVPDVQGIGSGADVLG